MEHICRYVGILYTKKASLSLSALIETLVVYPEHTHTQPHLPLLEGARRGAGRSILWKETALAETQNHEKMCPRSMKVKWLVKITAPSRIKP